MARSTGSVSEGPTEGGKLRPAALPSAELQQLWFACLRRDWSSLVVVPSHPGGSSLPVARALAEIGGLHRSSPVKLITAEGMDMSATSRLIIDITSHVATGGLAIVAIDSVLSNQAGIPVALSVDAALLCVDLQEADVTSATRTLELIGRDRFVGSVTLKPGSSK